MPETMTEPKIETLSQTPICATQKCKRPLTFLGPPQNCWRCLVCNPIREVKPTERPKKKYIDVTITEDMVREIIKEELATVKLPVPAHAIAEEMEERIREIVQDELANWHIQKPPVTRDDIDEAVGVGGENVHIKVQVPKPETWLQKAKRLGVRTHNEGTGGMRKKVEIMADIEAKQNEASPEGDKKNPSATVEKGA